VAHQTVTPEAELSPAVAPAPVEDHLPDQLMMAAAADMGPSLLSDPLDDAAKISPEPDVA
jgi:hypothetical protein